MPYWRMAIARVVAIAATPIALHARTALSFLEIVSPTRAWDRLDGWCDVPAAVRQPYARPGPTLAG